MAKTPHISIVIPLHNEEKNIPLVHKAVQDVFSSLPFVTHEIVFVDDGSEDNTLHVARRIASQDGTVRVIEFSRNFGKEAATSAGIHHSTGDAVMCLDADLQHPPELIPEFIERWQEGYDVVIGVRNNNASDTYFKKIGSHIFYKLMSKISHIDLIPRATDFRLIDRQVVDEFNKLSERNRITRGLIDWLGFRRTVIHFDAPERRHGQASYTPSKLVSLAFKSIVAHSLLPLRLSGYLGLIISTLAGLLGIFMFIALIWDLGLNFSGPAMLSTLILFLVGILLMSIGLLASYIEHIYHEVSDRPLYVVRTPRELQD